MFLGDVLEAINKRLLVVSIFEDVVDKLQHVSHAKPNWLVISELTSVDELEGDGVFMIHKAILKVVVETLRHEINLGRMLVSYIRMG